MAMFLILIIGAIGLLYYYLTKDFDYWKNKNIPGPKPKILVGNFPSILNKSIHNVHEVDKIYKEYKGISQVVGIFSGSNPTLLITDPDVAKKIMITDFKHFTDTVGFFQIDKETDPLIGRNPFFLRGEEWREKRGEILPAFSSGRIKALFPIMQEVADRMKLYIKREGRVSNEFETKELCGKYTTDVVASAIYGIESGAFSGQHSEIRDVARSVLSPSLRMFFVNSIAPFIPAITKIVKVKFCPDKEANFLTGLLNDALKYRIDNNIQRQDYLDFLIHLKEKKGLSDIDITAHTLTFFFDGIETSSTALAHAFYQLAKNKRVQDKLRQEMLKIRDKDGQFEYESLTENKYLEQVVFETLRLHPVLMAHFRECTKDYELELNNGKRVKIDKYTAVQIPIYSIARDPEYYGPDADEFNPERFDDENGGIKRYTDREVLFPFGDGPRVCLGQRFAKTQIKCCIAHVLTTFEIELSEKMPAKPEFDPMNLLLSYKGGVLLKMKPIAV